MKNKVTGSKAILYIYRLYIYLCVCTGEPTCTVRSVLGLQFDLSPSSHLQNSANSEVHQNVLLSNNKLPLCFMIECVCMLMFSKFNLILVLSYKKWTLLKFTMINTDFVWFQVKFPLSQAGGSESSMMNHRARTMDRKFKTIIELIFITRLFRM